MGEPSLTLCVQGRVGVGARVGLFDDLVGGTWQRIGFDVEPAELLDDETLRWFRQIGGSFTRVSRGDRSTMSTSPTRRGSPTTGARWCSRDQIFYVYFARSAAELPRAMQALTATVRHSSQHSNSQESPMPMRITRLAQAQPFQPLGHAGVGPVRLQGGQETPTDRMSVVLSHYLPGAAPRLRRRRRRQSTACWRVSWCWRVSASRRRWALRIGPLHHRNGSNGREPHPPAGEHAGHPGHELNRRTARRWSA